MGCKGKNKKTCIKSSECHWDTSINSCADNAVLTSDEKQDSPTESPTSLVSTPGPSAVRPTMGCKGNKKKQCVKTRECHWDTSINSCADNVVFRSGEKKVVDDDDCGKKKYHPTSVLERKCSNDDIFPSLWRSNPDRYFFILGDDCCAAFYSGGPCEVVTVCSTSN